MKTRRFVTEYANYLIDTYLGCEMQDDVRNEKINRISKYVRACEAGLISICECMKALSDIWEGAEK